MTEGFKIQEKLTLKRYDERSNCVQCIETYNPSSLWHRIKKKLGFTKCFSNDIVLDVGLADVALMIANRYGYIAVGTDDTAPEHDDMGLGAEIDRVSAATSIATTFYTNDTARFTATFTPEFDTTIYEAGLCKNASSGGDDITFARETYPAYSVVAAVPYLAVWDVVIMR
jgi:hypothetical protein